MTNEKSNETPRTCPRCGGVVLDESYFCQECREIPVADRKKKRAA